MILFHCIVAIAFFGVGLYIAGIFFKSKFKVFPCSVPFHQPDVDCPKIAIIFSNFRVSFDCFLVLFQCLWKFTYDTFAKVPYLNRMFPASQALSASSGLIYSFSSFYFFNFLTTLSSSLIFCTPSSSKLF